MTNPCPRCRKPLGCGQCRGCCSTCHAHYRNLVRRGTTTWAALEAAGKIAPNKHAYRMRRT